MWNVALGCVRVLFFLVNNNNGLVRVHIHAYRNICVLCKDSLHSLSLSRLSPAVGRPIAAITWGPVIMLQTNTHTLFTPHSLPWRLTSLDCVQVFEHLFLTPPTQTEALSIFNEVEIPCYCATVENASKYADVGGVCLSVVQSLALFDPNECQRVPSQVICPWTRHSTPSWCLRYVNAWWQSFEQRILSQNTFSIVFSVWNGQ